jgi:diguanylate cyclase (GGDEF)-like protein
MLEQIKQKLKTAVNFPSPPAVAQQIIALAADPGVDVVRVAAAIGHDPGLAAKVLRVANSPLYSHQRKSENLRQALIVLGLNGATTLALSFSLVGAYKGAGGAGIDYSRFWRRSILSASAARLFAVQQGIRQSDDVFLAALLQEIAVLAIDRVQPDFYGGLAPSATHAELAAHEHSRLGIDHAGFGAWLLTHWQLPEFLVRTVECSHLPTRLDRSTRVGHAARCVALGSECADLLLTRGTAAALPHLAAHADAWLGLGADGLSDVMGRIVDSIPEIGRLFETNLLSAESAAAILDEARELLMIRNLQSFEEVSALRATTEDLKARTIALQDQHRRDGLTGVFNRRHLDAVLEQEFQAALVGRWPLSVVFADLDRFKLINDTHGHATGDAVLAATANMLQAAARDTDVVARYGGEEFVVVLPGLGMEGAAVFCERLLGRLRETHHLIAGRPLTVTASLGLATHSAESPFHSVTQLLEAADRCVYEAKRSGRNRLVRHEPAPRCKRSGADSR